MENELFLLDTSIWIIVLKKNPPTLIKEKVEHLLKENSVAITPIINVELLGGTRTDIEFERLRKRLDSLIKFDIDSLRWNGAARLAFDLRRKGVNVPYTDILIAEMAIHHNATLLHLDRHFDMIARESPLVAENVF